MASAHELFYFPFYPRDFASDNVVEGMSTKGIGAYMLILCKAWFETPPGTVPDDDAILSRWARMSELEWGQIKGEVMAAFSKAGGRYVQKRMAAEWAAAMEKHERRAAAGRSGGQAKAKQSPSNALAMLQQCSSSQSQSQSKSQKTEIHGAQCEQTPTTRLLMWNQVQPLYDAYPPAKRGSKGEFVKAVGDAWAALLADGDTNPLETLLRVTKQYAAAFARRSKYAVGPERFYDALGVWTQNPADWIEPKGDEHGIGWKDRKVAAEFKETIAVPMLNGGGERSGVVAADQKLRAS